MIVASDRQTSAISAAIPRRDLPRSFARRSLWRFMATSSGAHYF